MDPKGPRKPKQWFTKVLYGNLNDLTQLVAVAYGNEAAKRIAYSIRKIKRNASSPDNFD